MPRYPINRATNFIVEQESWTVVEYDHTSVPGVIYLSLTQGKINSIYDDVENNLADTDKIANYTISTSQQPQNFSVGSKINPVFTLMKDGQICNEEIEYVPADKTIVKFVDGILTAVGVGNTNIIIRLKNYPQIQTAVNVNINNEEQEFYGYIEGPDFIRLDRECEYKFVGNMEPSGQVNFNLNTKLARLITKDQKTCVIKANHNNQLGSIILTAQYNNKIYTKEISIIPLW